MIFGLAAIVLDCMCSGEALDYSVDPQPHENFFEASFRFVIPDADSRPNTILVFIPGTDGDGRSAVTNATFLSMSNACHAALIGCHFRGEGLGYDDPSGGSGRALDKAISHFAEATNQPQLAQAPILLIGYSQGGMFAFNYICWRPERVKAFAALKAISQKFQPKPTSFCVPGLLVAGQTDEPERVQAIAKAFLSAAGKHSKWAFLLESGVGHELDPKSIGISAALFEAVCREVPADGAVYLNAETGDWEAADSTAAGLCWFPNQDVASTWKALHQPMAVQKLMSMPSRKKLEDFVTVKSEPEEFSCQNDEKQTGVLDLSGSTPGVTIDQVQIAGECFSVSGRSRGTLPMEITTCFSPRDLPWGRIRADIEIDGHLNGQSLEPFIMSVPGMIKGAVTAIPASVYLGVASREDVVDKKIRLKSSQGTVHVIDVKTPPGMTVTLDTKAEDDLEVHIHWIAGPRLGKMSGEILLAFDLPEKGTLKIPVIGLVSN